MEIDNSVLQYGQHTVSGRCSSNLQRLERILYDSQRADRVQKQGKEDGGNGKIRREDKAIDIEYTGRHYHVCEEAGREKSMPFTFLQINGVKCHTNDAVGNKAVCCGKEGNLWQ